MKVETLVEWREPESAGDKLHKPGEVSDIDPANVPDLDVLIQQGVVAPIISNVQTVSSAAPSAEPDEDGSVG